MALIPKHYLDAVAVLEKGDLSKDPAEFHPVATGTLLGYEAPDQSQAAEDETAIFIYLATNRHVIEGQSELWIRFNQGAGSQRFRIATHDEDGQDLFRVSQRFDVAVAPIDAAQLRDAGAEFAALPERAFLDLDEIEANGVVGGDGVFVLGFPMGIAGIEKKYAVVRGGVIARVDREIVEERNSFLIDCPVFPGNSGGPVVLRPELISLGDEPGRDRVHVIGIVSGFVPWIDTAVSQQTQRPRITFEENSGLADVVPLDAINELVRPMVEELNDVAENQPDDEEERRPGEAES